MFHVNSCFFQWTFLLNYFSFFTQLILIDLWVFLMCLITMFESDFSSAILILYTFLNLSSIQVVMLLISNCRWLFFSLIWYNIYLFHFFSLFSRVSTCYQFLSKIYLLDEMFLFFLHFKLLILFFSSCNMLLMFLNSILLIFLIHVSCSFLHNRSFSVVCHVSDVMSYFCFRFVLTVSNLFSYSFTINF